MGGALNKVQGGFIVPLQVRIHPHSTPMTVQNITTSMLIRNTYNLGEAWSVLHTISRYR